MKTPLAFPRVRSRRPRRRASDPASSPQVAPRLSRTRATQGAETQPDMASTGRRKGSARSRSAHRSPAQTTPWSVEHSWFRLLLVWLTLIFGGGVMGWRLWTLQVTQGAELIDKAQAQQQVLLRPFTPRRTIVDRTGNVLAFDRLAYTLYAHPIMFQKSQEAIAGMLAPILEKSEAELVAAFQTADTGIPLARGLSEDAADQVIQLYENGFDLVQEQQRRYPYGDLFAGVVGYVDTERQGQAGLEYSQTTLLEQPPKELAVQAMGNGKIVASRVPSRALEVDNEQLHLTLDTRLQRIAREALQQSMAKFQAKRGTVIVMDSKNGELLALVTEPSYDPNRYYAANLELFKNWTVSDLYEPGSTFKPINVAIALDAGKITPETLIYDQGTIIVDGWPINNNDFAAHGSLTISEVLEYSSNVGMVRIMERLSLVEYYNWLAKLGLGEETGIDLPFETAGNLKDKTLFTQSTIEGATHAFGQGFALNPLRLAQLHSALANGGLLVTPHVVRGLADSTGQVKVPKDRPQPKRVFKPETARAVVKMMENVVIKGTGKSAQLSGYRVGGKTGTAQKVSDNGGYYGSARICSFVGIIPIESPRYVVVTVVDEPQGSNAYGSTVAAPVVKAVMENLVTLEGVVPSQPLSPRETEQEKEDE